MGRPRARDRLPHDETAEPGLVVLGVIAAPGPCSDLAETLLPDLAGQIADRIPGVRWEVRYVSDRLVQWPADLSVLVSAARRRTFAEGWQLAVCITDLPLQTARRPIIAHASMMHGVAVLSLPALGPVVVTRRAGQAVVRLVAALLGGATDGGAAEDALLTTRAREMGGRVERDERGFRLVAGVVTGNLRLLLGMLRANRPWRLTVRLSNALVAALATGVLAIVLSDVWRIADGVGLVRLALLALGSVVAVVLAVIVGAGLWERGPPGTDAREQVILFNVVTVATVVIGVLTLYLALLAMMLVGALLLVPEGTAVEVVGHPVGIGGQLKLAWLGTSLATVAGALGAGLESDEAVREAAYGYQPDRQLSGG